MSVVELLYRCRLRPTLEMLRKGRQAANRPLSEKMLASVIDIVKPKMHRMAPCLGKRLSSVTCGSEISKRPVRCTSGPGHPESLSRRPRSAMKCGWRAAWTVGHDSPAESRSRDDRDTLRRMSILPEAHSYLLAAALRCKPSRGPSNTLHLPFSTASHQPTNAKQNSATLSTLVLTSARAMEPPPGIKNLGATSYLSALITALFSVPSFKKSLQGDQYHSVEGELRSCGKPMP